MVVFGKYVFHPRLVPTLATLLLLPVLIRLGVWQLDRAEEKRLLLQTFEEQIVRPAVEVGDVNRLQQLASYQKVTMRGRFDSEHQFLLDNKVYQGKVGYQVLTPFKLKDEQQSVLVNRGWIPMGKNREELPAFETPSTEIVIVGQVKHELAETLQIVESISQQQHWPSVVQWIEPVKFSTRLGYPLAPSIVLMDKDDDAGFVRDWFIKKIEPEKSTSYAVQWFSLALLLILIYVFTNTRKKEVE